MSLKLIQTHISCKDFQLNIRWKIEQVSINSECVDKLYKLKIYKNLRKFMKLNHNIFVSILILIHIPLFL